ncbi:hypothetical protein [Ferrigenium sp. UT5]|uniref:hypothetical protein n=1 Tax=Ferrigenium sp. UT5 TaxID=3242105 RepID=UPI00354F8AD7
MVDALVPSAVNGEARENESAAQLNGRCGEGAGIDEAALQRVLREQGAAWHALVMERCSHLFSAAPVFISAAQLQQMRAVIAAVENVVGAPEPQAARGVFYGYDFHLNADGAHLIEINTNAGGAFLNALLIESQRATELPGAPVSLKNIEQCFLEMFRHEWQLARGSAPLQTVVIVDEQPDAQYLYPEFLLAQRLFEHAGLTALVADPSALQAREDGLYCDDRRVDLIYNRLTDFDLQQHPHLRAAWIQKQVVFTPDPSHYARYADKCNLTRWSDAAWLRATGLVQTDIDALLRGIPSTQSVQTADAAQWWAERKAWFFKPETGYGSKGAYRGDKLTRRVFDEIMQGDYVAQRLQPPGERVVCLGENGPQPLKYDVRCYVYDGVLQLAAARLYQGQTTNFRTPGGGFAVVRLLA